MVERLGGADPSKYLGVRANNPPNVVISQRAPTTADTKHDFGTIWIDQPNNSVYQLTNVTSSSANWQILGSPTMAISTLSADSGGSISPVAGDVDIAGGTNVSTVATAGTITINLDPAISLATSVTSPVYTAAAATDLSILSATGQDIIATLGDNAAANFFIWEDSDNVDLMNLDSDGALSLLAGNLILNGAATQIQIQGGAATDFIGQATLSMGTVTVANTNIAAGDRIFLTRADPNSSTALGELTITALTALTSFVITALDPADGSATITGDTSIVNYVIVREI